MKKRGRRSTKKEQKLFVGFYVGILIIFLLGAWFVLIQNQEIDRERKDDSEYIPVQPSEPRGITEDNKHYINKIDVLLGEPFELRLGQTASVHPGEGSLTFKELVPNDLCGGEPYCRRLVAIVLTGYAPMRGQADITMSMIDGQPGVRRLGTTVIRFEKFEVKDLGDGEDYYATLLLSQVNESELISSS